MNKEQKVSTEATEFYLVRHGRTYWNDEGRWQGQADAILNETGRLQAEAVAGAFAETFAEGEPAQNLTAIYSSDLKRAVDTAEAIARRVGIPVQTDPRLREINLGEWQGLLSAELHRRWPETMARWEADAARTRPPKGETLAEVAARVHAAMHDIARQHLGECVIVVSHQIPIIIARQWAHSAPDFPGRELAVRNGTWVHLRSHMGESVGGNIAAPVWEEVGIGGTSEDVTLVL